MNWNRIVSIIIIVLFMTSAANADELDDLRQQLKDQQHAINELKLKVAGIEDEKKDFRVYWNDSLRMKSTDGDIELRVGGRFHNDWEWVSESQKTRDKLGKQPDGTKFRRARFYFSGRAYNDLEFMLQLDFSSGNVDFKNAYLGINRLIRPKILVGQFEEPFSLNELSSSNGLSFLERALPAAFVPSRNVGMMLADVSNDQKLTWSAGMFKECDDVGLAMADGGANATARLTWTPIYENSGKTLLHLGSAYTHKGLVNNEYRVRQRPETSTTDPFVDTGVIAAKSASSMGLEAAWVNGPLSMQGEFIDTSVDGYKEQQDLDFEGYYVQCSYWLTGEYRPYNRSRGSFEYVKPQRNFIGKSGGAWELAARYSRLNLSDHNINGGELTNRTLGVNWHLNPNARIMWGYVIADERDIGRTDIIQFRSQFFF
ncbi:MAG TPA: hypothetical protein DCG57_18515 [Candidatus Riflebacteria bacterium]|nr:hypothetical protein [Candidatus Riflebacteria bacterium]